MKKLNFKQFKNKKNFIFLIILNFLVKLPSFFNSIDPFVFIDEFIMWVEFEKLILNKSLIIQFFRVGGSLNYYPSLILLLPLFYILKFFEVSLGLTSFLIISRIILNILSSSISLIYLLKINNIINLNKNKFSNLILPLLFILNPYLLGQTFQWYPDSYLSLFTILCTYNLLLINKDIHYKKYIYRLFFLFALGTTVKITFFYFGIIIFVFFLFEMINKRVEIIYTLSKAFVIFVSTFLIFNISNFLHFNLFISDLNFMVTNYGERSFNNFFSIFQFHFIFLFLTPVGVIGFIFLVLDFKYLVKEKKYFILYLFYVAPLSYIVFLSLYPKFLNRNINLFVPVILLAASRGIDLVILKIKYNLKSFYSIILTLFIAIYVFSFSVTLYDDFKTDSRILAFKWINENVNLDLKSFGTNDNLIQDGYKELNNNLNIKEDYMEVQKYDIYVINSWGNSSLVNVSYPNLLTVLNHSNDHYIYSNNNNFLNKNYLQKVTVIESEYELVKSFKGNGPNLFLFQLKK